MWHRGKKGYRKVSKFFTRAIKHFCLTFKQAQQWEKVEALAASRCMLKIYLLLPASELISLHSVCATPHCATSFSHAPLLCLISRSLSSRASASPRDSESLNIHLLSSIAPTVLLEEAKKKNDIELFRAQSRLFLATALTSMWRRSRLHCLCVLMWWLC